MTGKQNTLFESGIVIAVGTAVLYCVNAAYFGGYFSPLQLDADLLDQNFHQILYNGFLKSFFPALIGIVLYIFLSVIYFGVKIFYSDWLFPKFNVFFQKKLDESKWLIKQRQRFIDMKNDNKIDHDFENHLSNIMRYPVILIGFLLLLIYFESEGHKAASIILKKIETNAIQENELIMVKIDGKPEKLFHLMCGARNCAGIDPKSKVVYYFPQNGHSFQLRELKAK